MFVILEEEQSGNTVPVFSDLMKKFKKKRENSDLNEKKRTSRGYCEKGFEKKKISKYFCLYKQETGERIPHRTYYYWSL